MSEITSPPSAVAQPCASTKPTAIAIPCTTQQANAFFSHHELPPCVPGVFALCVAPNVRPVRHRLAVAVVQLDPNKPHTALLIAGAAGDEIYAPGLLSRVWAATVCLGYLSLRAPTPGPWGPEVYRAAGFSVRNVAGEPSWCRSRRDFGRVGGWPT